MKLRVPHPHKPGQTYVIPDDAPASLVEAALLYERLGDPDEPEYVETVVEAGISVLVSDLEALMLIAYSCSLDSISNRLAETVNRWNTTVRWTDAATVKITSAPWPTHALEVAA